MTSVVLVDDQEMVRAGFRMILEARGVDVIGEAGDGAEGVAVVRRTGPDVVLMDVRMPGMDGIEATAQIVADGGGSRVLILTTFDLDEYVYRALQAGASGFLLKDARPDDLQEAIAVVAAGDALLAPSVTRRLIADFARNGRRPATPDAATRAALASLTEREREVLLGIARGRSNAEIAAELFVGEATVKSHVSGLLSKLGLRDRVQAVVLAYEAGLVTPGAGTRSHPRTQHREAPGSGGGADERTVGRAGELRAGGLGLGLGDAEGLDGQLGLDLVEEGDDLLVLEQRALTREAQPLLDLADDRVGPQRGIEVQQTVLHLLCGLERLVGGLRPPLLDLVSGFDAHGLHPALLMPATRLSTNKPRRQKGSSQEP